MPNFIPNLRFKKPTGAPVPIPENYPYSDVLFDYAQFLRDIESKGKIGTVATNKTVAVIGSGSAGIVAAYELLRAGVDVTLISADLAANERRFGRCFSHKFLGDEPYIAELGSMRFPPSEVCLFHYIKKFNIPYTDNFPDPGKVDTLLNVGGKNYDWPANGNPPAIFQPLRKGLDALMVDTIKLADGTTIPSIASISTDLKANNTANAMKSWQVWVDTFEPYSFRAALTLIFQQADVGNIPGGVRWTDEQISLFGTLGIGSGGFGPLYDISFVEIVRLFVNELESDQQFIPSGIASVFNAIASQKVGPKNLSVHDISKRGKVTSITTPSVAVKPEPMLTVTLDDGTSKAYNAVIVTISNWASQINTNITNQSPLPTEISPLINTKYKEALRNQHIISSSKAFVLTERKFWLDKKLPANIQSDTLVRGLYCLDYQPEKPDGAGVVLISYTWQDDAVKQSASGSTEDNTAKKKRFLRLVEAVASFNPDYAANLVPVGNNYDDFVVMIDWIDEDNYHGAFKLNHPGQDTQTADVFTHFQAVNSDATLPNFYLAGDGISFYGGWVEGALQTTLNAATAVIERFGATDIVPNNPIKGVQTSKYDYRTGKF